MTVPQFRDGECEIRQLWDAAVCTALGWDEDEIAELRLLLHEEPHVKGLGYGQHADEPDNMDGQDTTVTPSIGIRSRELQAGASQTNLTRGKLNLDAPEHSPTSEPQA